MSSEKGRKRNADKHFQIQAAQVPEGLRQARKQCFWRYSGDRDHIMLVKVHGVRFMESDRHRRFCVDGEISSMVSSYACWVTPLTNEGGSPRFKFEQLD